MTTKEAPERLEVNIDGGLPSEPQARLATTHGWRTVYHVITGEPSTLSENEYRTMRLRKDYKLPDGRCVYSDTQDVIPQRGTIICLLHKDHPDREFYSTPAPEGVGLAAFTCIRIQVPNEMELISHMEHRHPREYKAIKLFQENKDRQRQRDYDDTMLQIQQATLANMQGSTVKE